MALSVLNEYFLDSKQEEIVRPRSRRRPKTNEKKGEQIMVVCAWIVLQDVERRKNGCLKFQENSNPKPKGLGTCKQCKIKEGSVYTNIHSIWVIVETIQQIAGNLLSSLSLISSSLWINDWCIWMRVVWEEYERMIKREWEREKVSDLWFIR